MTCLDFGRAPTSTLVSPYLLLELAVCVSASDPGPSAIFLNEFDTSHFNCGSNFIRGPFTAA